MSKRTLAVAAVFLAGCAVGGVSAQLAVPKASAQQQAAVTKWEMYCKAIAPHKGEKYDDALSAAGTKAGLEGWEPVGGGQPMDFGTLWCFRRPKM